MLKNPQTLRSYPKAQIRQGADVVSAPTRRRYDGPGLCTTRNLSEARHARWAKFSVLVGHRVVPAKLATRKSDGFVLSRPLRSRFECWPNCEGLE